MGSFEIGKKTKFFVGVFLFITFLAVSVSPIQLFSGEAVVVEAAEGVDKTVKLNSDTVRFYMSKTRANNLLKTAGTASIFIPGNGSVVLGVKWLLALFGIWGSVPNGFSVDIQKDHHGRPPYYHNFKWQ